MDIKCKYELEKNNYCTLGMAKSKTCPFGMPKARCSPPVDICQRYNCTSGMVDHVHVGAFHVDLCPRSRSTWHGASPLGMLKKTFGKFSKCFFQLRRFRWDFVHFRCRCTRAMAIYQYQVDLFYYPPLRHSYPPTTPSGNKAAPLTFRPPLHPKSCP